MTQTATNLMDQGKKSLDTLLREKAYAEVVEILAKEGIPVESVSNEDIEALVEARVRDKHNVIKGVAMGGAFALLLSSVLGF